MNSTLMANDFMSPPKGIHFKEIQELFTVGCAPNSCVPEAVRVADLITKRGLCLLESQ